MHIQFATAADLPGEIIAGIVECTVKSSIGLSEFDAIRLEKRILGNMSLVCRYWAQRVRERIFGNLELRSRNDFCQLLSFLDSPTSIKPSISDCLYTIRVLQTGTWEVPWLHRMRAELLAHATELRIFIITLESTSVRYNEEIPMYAPSTLSALLPRSLPNTVYPFQTLNLDNLRFRCISDLVRLIDSTPSAHLMLTNITIVQPKPWAPVVRRRRRYLGGITIGCSGSTADQAEIACFVMWHLRGDLRIDLPVWNSSRNLATSWLSSALPDSMVIFECWVEGEADYSSQFMSFIAHPQTHRQALASNSSLMRLIKT